MIQVYVHNESKIKINEAFFKKLAREVLKKEKKKEGLISIVLVPAKKAQELNLRYLNKNYIPEVLSFLGE